MTNIENENDSVEILSDIFLIAILCTVLPIISCLALISVLQFFFPTI